MNWYHNGLPLASEYGITVMKAAKISTLSIDDLRAEHRGNYTCVTTNSAGRVEYTSQLNINGY